MTGRSMRDTKLVKYISGNDLKIVAECKPNVNQQCDVVSNSLWKECIHKNLRKSSSWFEEIPTQVPGPLQGTTLEEFAQNLGQF